MEAIAALGLACSVIQLVDFGLTLTEKCRDIYKAGDTSQNKASREDAETISFLAQAVDQSLQASTNGTQPTLQHDILQRCAQECIDAAQEVENLIKTMTTTPGRRRDALKMSLKTMWKKDEIKEVQKRLEKQQAILNTSILVDLRKRGIAREVRASVDFSKLNTQVQNIAIALTQNMTSVTTIASFLHTAQKEVEDKIQDEGRATRTLINAVHANDQANLTKELGQLRVDLKDSYATKLLQSLAFPEMNSRREDVCDAHAQTFGWMFGLDGPVSDASSESASISSESSRNDGSHGFVEWLQTGTGCYWINGRAGSGKSTLMNFIYEAEECERHLHIWAKGAKLLRPNFFFWNPGIEIQKSVKGLLRALTYQILESDMSLSDQVGSILDTHQKLQLDHGGQPDIVWSEKKLRFALQSLIAECQHRGYRLCLFIDGLDEFEGDRLGLLEWISTVTQSAHVKACISSRPWALFAEAFASSPQLKLQDLTRSDVRSYINDEFTKKAMARMPNSNVGLVLDLADAVQSRADGVFLWVKLVVRDLLEALPKGYSFPELHERLRSVPDELEELFQHMIDKHIDKVYRKKAFEYFQLMLSKPDFEMSLLVLALATWEPLRAISITDMRSLDRKAGLHQTHLVKNYLSTRTAGLIDVSGFKASRPLNPNSTMGLAKYHNEEDTDHLVARLLGTRVKFLHRSVFDWLSGTGRPQEISGIDDNSNVLLLLKASAISHDWLDVSPHEKCREFWGGDSITSSTYDKIMNIVVTYALFLQRSSHEICDDLLDFVGETLVRHSHTDPWYECFSAEPESCFPWIDFPGFAMSYGLTQYAYNKLCARPPQERKSYAEYLLCCMSLAYYDSHSALEQSHMVRTLLTIEGADPNACVSLRALSAAQEKVYTETTPWLQCSKSFAMPLIYNGFDPEKISRFADIAHVFVESGANVTKSLLHRHVIALKVPPKGSDGIWLYLYFDLSLAAMCQTTPFKTVDNVPRLSQALVRNNGVVICKPSLLVKTYRAGSGRARRSFPLKISETKLEELAEPLKSCILGEEFEFKAACLKLLNVAEELWEREELESFETEDTGSVVDYRSEGSELSVFQVESKFM